MSLVTIAYRGEVRSKQALPFSQMSRFFSGLDKRTYVRMFFASFWRLKKKYLIFLFKRLWDVVVLWVGILPNPNDKWSFERNLFKKMGRASTLVATSRYFSSGWLWLGLHEPQVLEMKFRTSCEQWKPWLLRVGDEIPPGFMGIVRKYWKDLY